VAAVTVNRVGSTGTTSAVADSAALAGLTAGSNGALSVRSGTGTTGTLSIDAAVLATGSGHLLLEAGGGALRLNADVDAGSGHASLVSSGALVLAADADLRSTGTATLDLRAASVEMAHGSTLSTGSGNVRIAATGALQLGAVSTTGDVSLAAQRISDAFASGTDTVNVTADELRIVTSGTGASDGAGSAANALELAVNALAADVNGAGGLFASEADALQIGTLSAINVNQVGANGTTLTATTDTAQSNLDVEGALVIVAGGSITTLAAGGAVSASGHLLLQAGGASGDITLGAVLGNDTGATSLNAARDLLVNASLGATGAGMSMDLLAGRDITMADGTRLSSSDADIAL
jgi:hypothetical protein